LVAHDKNLNSTISPLGVPTNVYNINVIDTTPPTITHTPISSVNEGQPINVTAFVTDNSGDYPTVKLFYRSMGQPAWNPINMTQNNNIYSATIPGSSVSFPKLEYYLQAQDSSSNISTSPNNAPQNSYQVTVNDTTPPTITHTPVTSAEVAKDINISAQVTDNAEVKSVRLYFKNTLSPNYQIINMSRAGNNFSAVIPAFFVTLDGIQYYLEAEDVDKNTTLLPTGAPTDVYNITVVDTFAPSINHQGPLELEFGKDLYLRVKIEDKTPIAQAQVCVFDNCSDLLPISNSIYETTIPAENIRHLAQGIPHNYFLSYQFKASDYSGNIAQSRVYQIKMTDQQTPTIQHNQNTDYFLDGDALKIQALITDNHFVAKATLNCKKADQNQGWETTEMTNGPLYLGSCNLKELKNTFGINYFFTASDVYENTAISPIYFIPSQALKDDTPPQIIHQPAAKTLEKVDLLILAEITDDLSGVDTAKVTYINKHNRWKTITMTSLKNTYTATIPAEDVIPDEINYYISAFDKWGNKTETSIYIVEVEEATSPEVPEVISSSGCGCSIVR
ncbi:MAG: hypothetical protein ACPL4K_02495, partial [Candidatus Margulisiibacteriota bacterium]